jgi:hypothetical protein
MRTDPDAQAMQAAVRALSHLHQFVQNVREKETTELSYQYNTPILRVCQVAERDLPVVIAQLEAALAQPAPEPVAIVTSVGVGGRISGALRKGVDADAIIGKPLYTAPAAALEQGIRMGLEAAAKAVSTAWRQVEAIRALDPATIAEGKS